MPCLNEEGYIYHLLEALRIQDYPLREVIVVDCGSTDGTLPILESFRSGNPAFPLSFMVRPQATIPEALNAGIASGTGEIVVRLDAHSCPTRTYIRQSVEALVETGAGVVGGVWEIVAGGDSTTARAIQMAVSHPLGAGDARYRIGVRASQRLSVDTVPYGCFSRETWERIGRYNEQLWTNEDYEFNYRVRLSGLGVILDPAIRCGYVARGTLRELAAQYFRYGWWKARMLRQHPRSLKLRQAIPVAFVAALVLFAAGSVFATGAMAGLLALVAAHLIALSVVSFRLRRKAHDPVAPFVLPAVFATIHCCWGGGMLVHLLSLGRWPDWSRRDPGVW